LQKGEKEMYHYRSEAVLTAKMKGVACFATVKTSDGWIFTPVAENDVWRYAIDLAEKHRSFIHHAEATDSGSAKLIVTCRREEITEELPDFIPIEPLVGEIWNDNVRPERAEKKEREPRVATGEPQVLKLPKEGTTVRRVWDICETCDPEDKAGMVAKCVAEGINESTARTQMSIWRRYKRQ